MLTGLTLRLKRVRAPGLKRSGASVGLMTPGRMLRPVLLGLAGLATASCSLVESDPNRFEAMARSVAEIPLDGASPTVATAQERDLRPALVAAATAAQPDALRVEVMDPHDLWDARDVGLRGAVERAAPDMIHAAAPVLAQAVVDEVVHRASPRSVAPAISRTVSAPEAVGTILQLGAFSSPEAARVAWSRIVTAGPEVAELSPLFEAVEVDGRNLTRLKVVAGREAARAVCRAADAADLGCLRRG